MREARLLTHGIVAVLLVLLMVCVLAPSALAGPAEPEDGGMIDTASPPPRPRPAGIPAAAWTRPLGMPVVRPGVKSDVHPMIDDGPYQGVPLGGIGAGTIGRTFRGDFASWNLETGIHRYGTVVPDQFSLYVEQDGQSSAHVLSTLRSPNVLHDWAWDYPVGAGDYYALYPRAWFVYDWDQLPVRLTQEQFSPVIPHNDRESSYPVAVFAWRAENMTSVPVRVGLMLTWENFVGRAPVPPSPRPGGRSVNTPRREGDVVGIAMTSDAAGQAPTWDGSLAIAALETPGVEVSYRGSFPVDASGADIWADFAADGRLDNGDGDTASNAPTATALAVTFELGPGETRTLPFALAWDFPIAPFPSGARWQKEYTRTFGAGGDNAWRIAAEGLRNYSDWRAAIEAWQKPILDDPQRPEWYKTALFNELYDIADGGTLWGRPSDRPDELSRFGYLECFDYPYYGTFDVAFYSSWALLQLWPTLERQEMLQFAATIGQEDRTKIRIGATGALAPRKLAGAVPHDLGSPTEDPLLRANAYDWQDINVWKDLNLKYVLRAYRDYVALDDRALMDAVWPTIPTVLDYVRKFDTDGDGLLDHHGADQTYDNWTMEGPSAYTGSLLIAALEAASRMARAEGDEARAADFDAWLAKARESFDAELWNGTYYLHHGGKTPQRDSIMADQLVGQWYAGAIGLPDVAPKERIRAALQTVYDFNVMRFADGQMGAVNGMRPDGRQDTSSMQALEVWSGTTYALAALMLQEGLTEQGWQTAHGAYNVTYVTHGLWFRTPEAWTKDGRFRVGGYMRPQSIWAIEYALDHPPRPAP